MSYCILPLSIFLAFEQWTVWTASLLSVFPVTCWMKSNEAWLPVTKAMMTFVSVFIQLFAFWFKHSYRLFFYTFQTYCHVVPCCPPESMWQIWHLGSLNKNTVADGSAAFIPEFSVIWVNTVWSKQLVTCQVSFVTSLLALLYGGLVFQELFLTFDHLLSLQRDHTRLSTPDLFGK